VLIEQDEIDSFCWCGAKRGEWVFGDAESIFVSIEEADGVFAEIQRHNELMRALLGKN